MRDVVVFLYKWIDTKGSNELEPVHNSHTETDFQIA